MRWILPLIFISSLAFAENRAVVAIIDTGINIDSYLIQFLCKIKPIDFTGTGISDDMGHGTNITATILKDLDPKKVCFVPIKFFSKHSGGDDTWIQALSYSTRLNPLYVNASLSGIGSLPNELNLVQSLLARNTTYVVAAGNNGLNLDRNCIVYPACLNIVSPNFRVVGGLRHKIQSVISNYGRVVTDWMDSYSCYNDLCMEGTSQAAAKLTNKLLKVKYGKK